MSAGTGYRPDLPSLPPPPVVGTCPNCGRTFTAPTGFALHRCVDGRRVVDHDAEPDEVAAALQTIRQSAVLDVLIAGDWRTANPELYSVAPRPAGAAQ